MRKALTILALTLVARVGCYAHIIKTEGLLAFLQGQEKLNVVFNYDDLKIQGIPEKDNLAMQQQKCAEDREEAKTSLYGARFWGFLNKNVAK